MKVWRSKSKANIIVPVPNLVQLHAQLLTGEDKMMTVVSLILDDYAYIYIHTHIYISNGPTSCEPVLKLS